MTLSLLRAGALSCALLTSTAFTTPALAQTNTQMTNIPADQFAINPHGVDMRSGRFVYSQTDVAIGGGEGEGGLSLTRTIPNTIPEHIDPFGNFSHDLIMMISERRINFDEGGGIGNDFRMMVHMGGLADTFDSAANHVGFTRRSGGPLTRLTWSGSRTSGTVVYIYTAADGTVAVFRPLGAAGDSQCAVLMRCAFVSHVIKPDGTRLDFDYAYDGSAAGNRARLRRVISSRGYALLLEGGTNIVTKACVLNLAHAALPANGLCPVGVPTATYTYDSTPPNAGSNLTGATDAANATWGFTYNGSFMGFVKPGESTPWLTNQLQVVYDEEGTPLQAVSHQRFATGETYSYGWDQKPVGDGNSHSIHGGAYTDGAGEETVYRYEFPIVPGTGIFDGCQQRPCLPHDPIDEGDPGQVRYQVTPGPVEIRDPLGRTTTLQYCNQQAWEELPPTYHERCWVEPNVIYFTDPQGIQTWPTFDANNNITRVRRVARDGSEEAQNGPTEIVTSATYNILNPIIATQPTSITDANGNVTQYTYDPVHGGVLTETGPAPTPGAPRPQTRHEYAQRHAWISNGADGYVQGSNPLWVRTATSMCRNSAATGNPANPCATPGDEVRTTYDYGPDLGPNNLQLRGQAVTADGVTLHTCFTYDPQGRRIAETTPGAGLTQCQ